MAKRKRNSQNGGKNKKKRAKRKRFWIEDFPSIDCDNPNFFLGLSASFLSDDHHAQRDDTLTTKTISEVSTAESKEAACNPPKSDPVDQTEERKLDDTKSPTLLTTTTAAAEEDLSPRIRVHRDPTMGCPVVYPIVSTSSIPELPDGDCGDGVRNPHADVDHKYWAQRKRLFSRFDEGIQMDAEGWFAVTPELIAQHQAKQLVEGRENVIVLDAFGGLGGNTIALAARPEVALVVCVELDESRLQRAAHNCSVYSVPQDKVLFLCGDAFAVIKQYKDCRRIEANAQQNKELVSISGYKQTIVDGDLPDQLDCIFLSPPWGGPEYLKIGPRQFSLENIVMTNGEQRSDGIEMLRCAHRALSARTGYRIAIFLPKNTNGLTLATNVLQTGAGSRLDLEMNVMNGKFKTVTAYI